MGIFSREPKDTNTFGRREVNAAIEVSQNKVEVQQARVAEGENLDDHVGVVYQTKDHHRFKHIVGNRRINPSHVKHLIKSHKAFGQLVSPIMVNEKMEIVDGQHRHEVWKQLGMPVYYFMRNGYGLAEMKQLNLNTKNWTMDSYMEGAVDQEMEHYINYRGFKADYKFGHNLCLMVVHNRASRYKEDAEEFKKWEMESDNWEEVYARAERLKSVAPYYEYYRLRNFSGAMLGIMKIPGYNHERMLNKMSLHKDMIPDRASTTGYRAALNNIYNNGYAPGERLNLKFKDSGDRIKGKNGKFVEKV